MDPQNWSFWVLWWVPKRWKAFKFIPLSRILQRGIQFRIAWKQPYHPFDLGTQIVGFPNNISHSGAPGHLSRLPVHALHSPTKAAEKIWLRPHSFTLLFWCNFALLSSWPKGKVTGVNFFIWDINSSASSKKTTWSINEFANETRWSSIHAPTHCQF